MSSGSDHSTTRLIVAEKPAIAIAPGNRMRSMLFLPEGNGRNREGGLRTRGMFKRALADKPLVTVVTVVFNGAQELERTILSIINQTYDNLEYIVVDGGSMDGTMDVLRKYDHAIDYWVSEKDRGIYDAMNKGVDLAFGEWLNFMNAGDLFTSADIVKRIFSEKSNYGENEIIYSDTLFKYPDGLKTFRCDIGKRLFIHQAIFYRRELHVASGYYLVAEGMTISDYLFFMVNHDRKWFKFDSPICTYSPYGVSAGLGTFRQKVAVDIMLGFLGRTRGAMLLLVHPAYNRIKRIFLWVRSRR